MADASERTEPGTPKRKRESRERGEVARSPELSINAGLIAGLAAVSASSSYLYFHLSRYVRARFRSLPTGELGTAEWCSLLNAAALQIVTVLAPVLGALLAAALLANYLQVGFMLTPVVLSPKWDRLNPLSGLKRIFSMHGWVELLKAAAKLALTGAIVWGDLKKQVPGLIAFSGEPLSVSLDASVALFWSVCWKIGGAFLVLGAADYAWKRYEFTRKQRMTRQEVRDEMKESEGDPQIKGKQRSRHRKLARTRMAAEVAKADVVTINPTHYAVALRYDPQKMRAPRVVAKGQRWWAKLIVGIARRHRVPVIQNKLVTRTLYKMVEVGQEIPPNLYRAVAEILAALYRLRTHKGGKK